MGNRTRINLDNSKILQLTGDTLSLSGTTYFGNAEYIPNPNRVLFENSFVSKKYLEEAVSGITGGSGGGISGATNGLTIDNNIVKLGGTLVENTEIIGQSYNLGITANTINFDANIILDGIVETGNTITDNILSKNKTNNKVKIIDTVELTSDIIDDLLKISIVFTSGNTSLNGAYNNKLIIHTTTGNTLTLASGLTDGTKFNIKYYNQDETLIIDGDGIDIDFLSTLTLSGNTTYTEIVYSETLNKFLALK